MHPLWLIALCACFSFSQAGSKLTDHSRSLAFQLGRRDLLTAGGTTLGLAAVWGSFYQRLQRDEASYDERKTRLFKCLDTVPFAEVLEVGIGGNPTLGGFANLPYYKYGTTVIGLDPALDSPAGARSLKTAQAYAARLGVTLTAKAGTAEALPFADASFDAVVSTLVFCSVKDPEQCIREVARVLKPGGRWLFLEHVAAHQPGPLLTTQKVLDPLQVALASGCHLTRQTDSLIAASAGPGCLFSTLEGFESFTVASRYPASPQVMGVAVK